MGGVGWAELALQITTPDMDPATLSLGETCDFTAVATLDGKPLDATDLTWEWDFGDKSELCKDNPAPHAYTDPGEYLVTVAAFYEKQSTSAKVTVIVEGVMLNYPTDGPGIIIFTPDVGGEICDTGAVLCAVPRAWLNANPSKSFAGARFYRYVNGQWEREDEAGDGWVTPDPYDFLWEGAYYKVCRLGSWFTPSLPNVSTTWKADYWIGTPSAPPPGRVVYTPYTTPQRSVTPNNGVVTSTSNPLIFHTDNPQSHPIEWNVAHLDYPTTPQHIQFAVTVTVHNLSGDTVWTGYASREGPGGGTTIWPGTVTGGGSAAKGIYTFKVTATHSENQGCSDQDKAETLAISDVDTTSLTFNERDLVLEGSVEYTLSEDADEVTIQAYRPDLQTAGSEITGTCDAGENSVEVSIPVTASCLGTYCLVVQAKETEEAAETNNNRDQQQRWAVPKGCGMSAIARTYGFQGVGSSLNYVKDMLEEAGEQQEHAPDGTHYPPPAYNADLYLINDAQALYTYPRLAGQDPDTGDNWTHRDALIMFAGHGSPGQLHIQNTWADWHKLRAWEGTDGTQDCYYLPNLPSGCLSRCLCVLLVGCETGLDAPDGSNLLDVFTAKGAGCAIGSTRDIYTAETQDFSDEFWRSAMEDGATIGAAIASARVAADMEPSDWATAGDTSQSIRPGRYQ
ncbi:MAG: PKD domain-containing protein [Armatimonadetes bacterium]|nr:PKD domain-containing protein [Armatimonadota bacterium]